MKFIHCNLPPFCRLALAHKVPIITTIAGANATVGALEALQEGQLDQVPLQDYFKKN